MLKLTTQTAVAIFQGKLHFIAWNCVTNLLELRFVLVAIPDDISQISQEYLGVKRLSSFLATPDLDHILTAGIQPRATQPAIHIKGSISWKKERQSQEHIITEHVTTTNDAPFSLVDLDLSFSRGSTTLITGKFGCGKTLLLLALLGEVNVFNGAVCYALSEVMDPAIVEDLDCWRLLKGTAYVPQVSATLTVAFLAILGQFADIRRPGYRASVSGKSYNYQPVDQ